MKWLYVLSLLYSIFMASVYGVGLLSPRFMLISSNVLFLVTAGIVSAASLWTLRRYTAWGIANIRIKRANPPIVEIVVKNPPIKTIKGSQKHLIGSFWAGAFTRYFNRQLMCKNFAYNVERDEFSCTITI